MHKRKFFLSMLPLLLVLFIDGMGLGLLFPLLNTIILEPHAGFLPEEMSIGLRDFYYGLTIGVFMLCWFFGAAILGDLSDDIGRKKCLMICLLGSFLGYLLSAFAIEWESFWMLIIGRMIAGFTAGSQPIAQAAIVDISPAEDKARNIGFILLAVSLGFVLGPIIGGVLSNHNLVSWFGFAVPMYFAAFLSALNALLLSMTFQETFVRTAGKISIQWNHALKIFLAAFQHQGIRRYAVVLLIMIFGWSNYFSFISMYLLQTYHYSTMQNSLFLAVMGIGFSIGCGFLVDFVSKRFHAEHVVTIGLGATAIFVLITLLSPQQWVAWVCSFFIGVSLSVGYSVLLTIFSDQVGENEQGWVMGVTGSIMALCFGLTSVFTGLTAQMGAEMPMLFAFFGLGFSAVLIFFMKGREERA